MAESRVIKPGMLTTIQDLGRWGFQSRGVPVAGPMDVWSHRLANALAGNTPDAATLEVTLLGPELEFDDMRAIAVAGAEFEVTIDGRPAPWRARFTVPAGSRLRLGRALRGRRAYIAIGGGIDVAPVLGSRATHLASAMGGMNGRRIESGDRLPLGDIRLPTPRGVRLQADQGRLTASAKAMAVRRSFTRRRKPAAAGGEIMPLPDGHARIRVLPGPQAEYFTDESLQILQSAPYSIGLASDRMGFRLEGAPLAYARGIDVISDATAIGALQVPSSGLPILLMADRQTTGGYPTIATVITADVSVAGQLGPGDTISFVVCSVREAMAALIAGERALMAVERAEGA